MITPSSRCRVKMVRSVLSPSHKDHYNQIHRRTRGVISGEPHRQSHRVDLDRWYRLRYCIQGPSRWTGPDSTHRKHTEGGSSQSQILYQNCYRIINDNTHIPALPLFLALILIREVLWSAAETKTTHILGMVRQLSSAITKNKQIAMMYSATPFSIAGGVVTFVEFEVKLVSLYAETRRSKDGDRVS